MIYLEKAKKGLENGLVLKEISIPPNSTFLVMLNAKSRPCMERDIKTPVSNLVIRMPSF